MGLENSIIYEIPSAKDSTYGYPELCVARQGGALPSGAAPLAFVVNGEITLSPFRSWNFSDEEIVRYVETGKYLPTRVYSRVYNDAGGIRHQCVYEIVESESGLPYAYFDVDDPETVIISSPDEPGVWLTRFGGRLTIGIDRRAPGLSGAGDPVWEDAPTRESAEPPATDAAADLSRYEDESSYIGTATLTKLRERLFGDE